MLCPSSSSIDFLGDGKSIAIQEDPLGIDAFFFHQRLIGQRC